MLSVFLIVDFAKIEVAFRISTLVFALTAKCYQVQDCVTVRDTEQFADFLIRGIAFSRPVADMHPASTEVILFGSKQNVGRSDSTVLDPELTPVELNHDNYNSISTDDL